MDDRFLTNHLQVVVGVDVVLGTHVEEDQSPLDPEHIALTLGRVGR
jgi:hypothetical protein